MMRVTVVEAQLMYARLDRYGSMNTRTDDRVQSTMDADIFHLFPTMTTSDYLHDRMNRLTGWHWTISNANDARGMSYAHALVSEYANDRLRSVPVETRHAREQV